MLQVSNSPAHKPKQCADYTPGASFSLASTAASTSRFTCTVANASHSKFTLLGVHNSLAAYTVLTVALTFPDL